MGERVTYGLYLDKAVMGGGRERKNEEEEAEGDLHEPVMKKELSALFPPVPLLLSDLTPLSITPISLYHPHQPIFYFFYWSLTLIIIRANIY